MSVRTFAALVTNGQLRFQESLLDLEGQHVLVTLVSAPTQTTAGNSAEPLAPDWMTIEQDVVFQMPFHWERVHGEPIEAGALRPTVIVPEDLPDE